MANPNLLNATAMYAKVVTGSAAGTAITCPTDKLIKIVSITLANNTGSSVTGDPHINLNDKCIYTVASIGDNTNISGYPDERGIRMPLYLQETHHLAFVDTGALEWTVSYEEYS